MELNELLEYLDMDSPEDFSYFEHLADLVELEQTVDYDAFFQLLSQVPAATMQELLQNYFADITAHMPDSTVDIHTLMAQLRQCLCGLARQMESEEGCRAFTEELYRFRNWYALEGEVAVKHIDSGHRMRVSVSEALALSRLEALGGDAYDYDFGDCLEYPLDEYSMSINEAMSAAYGDAPFSDEASSESDSSFDSEAPSSDFHSGHRHQQELIDGLVDLENPVMDDEFSYLDE